MNGKNQKKISTSLVLTMTLLVAVPVAVLTVISLFNTIRQGSDSANEVNTAQAALVGESIETIYMENIAALKGFASAPSTIAFLEEKNAGGAGAEVAAYVEANGEGPAPESSGDENILKQMKSIDASMNDGNSTAISGMDGQQLLRTTGKPVNVAEREYFKEPMNGADFYISDMIISKSTGTAISTFSVPVYSQDGSQVIGIVQRNYDVGVLHDLLAGEVTQDRQEIVVVDRTGTVVAHSLRSVNVEDPEMQDQNPFYTDSRGDKTEGSYVAPFMGDTWMISWEKMERSGWIVASCRVKEVALGTVYKTAAMQIILGLIFLGISVFVGLKYAKSITNPLQEVNTSLAGLAEGKFYQIDKFTVRKDELGEIIRNSNEVMEKLRDIVGNIVSSANTVHSAADELAGMSDQISQNVDGVSNAVQDIAAGATQQADEIQNATENTNRIADAVGQVQGSTTDLEDVAGRMQTASSESAHSLEKLQKSSENMNDAIRKITDKISATSEAVEDINDMVESITNIASQTNLLALNASIEAARAGEAGRGFAVVAEEIGKLATESNESAGKIRNEMDKLLTESQSAVEMANEVQKTNNEQQEVIADTAKSVNGMLADIEDTVRSVRTISDNAEDCVTAKDVVADAMDSLSAISEENAASSEETGASMEELAATVTTLAQNAASLRDVSVRLSDEMKFFKM